MPLSAIGAPIFNVGLLAQVLEGPLEQVERNFETIQRDMRDDDISVLECGQVLHRVGSEWLMAYAGTDSGGTVSLEDVNLAEILEKSLDRGV